LNFDPALDLDEGVQGIPASCCEVGSGGQDLQEKAAPILPADLAGLAAGAITTNGMVTAMYSGRTMGVDIGLQDMVLELDRQVRAAQIGDREQAIAMLHCQASTLNAIFVEMARRAALNMNSNIPATEAYMRMALRAQNQSRATLETLSDVKNHGVVVAKQANITTGPQQVNNVMFASCKGEFLIPPNQLSGDQRELRPNP
jgi:hypothetical protein